VPVDAPEGTAARPCTPLARVTSTSTVGLPRLSRISRPTTCVIFPITLRPSPQPLAVLRPQRAALSRYPHRYEPSRGNPSRTVMVPDRCRHVASRQNSAEMLEYHRCWRHRNCV